MAAEVISEPDVFFLYGDEARRTRPGQLTSIGPRINMRHGSAAICKTNTQGEISVCGPCPIKDGCEFFKSKTN